ncbi:MAG TPA: DinB family protein [Candidatus Limnocylindria bacterium]|nr:DinB family protein [Candidatus Limnocylindria bacterium]
MTPAERERATTYLAETRERLLRTMRGLSPAQLQYKPAPDRWSVAECVEHIIMVESFLLANVEKTLQRAADSTSPVMGDDAIVQRVVARLTRVKGPDHLMPTARWPHDKLLPEFEGVRRRTAEFTANVTAELRQHTFPHPIFGPCDCYQWLLFIGAHGERHRAQAEEVMADSRFPRAAAAV